MQDSIALNVFMRTWEKIQELYLTKNKYWLLVGLDRCKFPNFSYSIRRVKTNEKSSVSFNNISNLSLFDIIANKTYVIIPENIQSALSDS
jgi:hypothetical protein